MSVTVSDFILRFGRHKGSCLGEVPKAYLEWCIESGAGGPDTYAAISAYLGVFNPFQQQKTVQATPSAQIKAKSPKPHIGQTFDCSDRFNPNADWPERQEWDGVTAPWLDQGTQMDDEFRSMFG